MGIFLNEIAYPFDFGGSKREYGVTTHNSHDVLSGVSEIRRV